MHASENGSSGDNKELTEEIRFPIPDSVLDLFSTKTLSNFVGKTMEYLHPDGDYLATRNLSDRNMSAQKIQAGNASDKIPMTEEEIQQVFVTVERKFKTTQKAQQLTEIRRAIVVKLNNSAAKARKQQIIANSST
ncbi:Uncharacterized protein APZ42_009917 [Daphnia magna]|uniref:BEN domain-containing protein n=1 Tax=Daphnia magna TaxID=35525 RepID=A0A164DPM0_9CRUS|nr:Uncharacterized protein APZ42_009917 [Daphnia magna]